MTVQKLLKFVIKDDDIIDGAPFLKKQALSLRIDQCYELAEFIDVDPVDLIVEMCKQRCRNCGCTNDDCSQCVEKTGEACHWVEGDLCSACADN